MNRTEFLNELARRLKGLPADERAAALSYYEEYLDDAGAENEAAAIAGLGTPAQVASGIIGDYAIKGLDERGSTPGGGLSMLWVVILGVLASPIWLPVGIVLVAVLLSVLATVFSTLLSLFVTAIALALAGIVGFGLGIYVGIAHFPTGLFLFGAALLMIGVGIGLFLITAWLSRVVINGIVYLSAKMLRRKGARS
ncbi:MAG: DUF1700 domain-containing protein [Actinomycetes bacterium]|jgi:uncharacterized membrane protein|nr:DUF1700 domain-containing protein [Actinomycetes bacterium]